MAEYVLGCMPSPDDERDLPLSKLVAELEVFPDSFVIDYPGKVKNQGSVGKCVGMSGSYTRAIKEFQQSGTFKDFSEDFIYANRLDTDHQGSGMYPRQMLDRLLKDGAVYSEDFLCPDTEYEDLRAKLGPVKEQLLPKAQPHKITAYCRLIGANQIKSALMRLGPVSICAPIYKSFYTPSPTGIVKTPDPQKEELLGYHQMTLLGWKVINKKTYWIVLNSWGDDWGDKGYCYMNMDFPIQEAWSITDELIPDNAPKPVEVAKFKILVITLSSKTMGDKYASVLQKYGFKTQMAEENGKYPVSINGYLKFEDVSKDVDKLQHMGFRPKVLNI